ncbi:MAG: family 78 glycoside hydrolase catalytic domain [Thermoguttaceae bacterium]
MRALTTTLLLLTLLAPCLAAVAGDHWPIMPARLRCEYQEDPIAVEAARPRLSWICRLLGEPPGTGSCGQRQTAYEIVVASSGALLQQEAGDLWHSGKVASDQSIHVEYAGRPLESRRQYFWKVRLWDQDGRASGWSTPASFGMGLLAPADWQARWIAAGTPPQDKTADGRPLPIFRREFEVAKPVRRAVVYVCGLGHYELHLDGQKVGDHELDPGWTHYRKTCLYAAYDVTERLISGRHALGVMLGNGMYNVAGGRYVKFRGSFGPPKLILQLHVDYDDGSESVVATDGSWRTVPGPIVFSCTYGGEDYDARREVPGWDRPGLDDAAWAAARVVEGPGGVLRAQQAPPIKIIEQLQSVRVTQPRPGIFVYDLGRNFSGWPRLSVSGPAGATIKLTPGELLDGAGLVSQESSGGPVSFSYTLRGGRGEQWTPRFSYYGFRYVRVEGGVPAGDHQAPASLPRVADVRGQFLHSSAEPAGGFECSDPLINRIHRLIVAAIQSNLQSVLTDCPHREKLGWLEVSHLLARGIMYNYDVAGLYAKISQDMAEAQTADGLVPDTAPEYAIHPGGFRDSPEWGSASLIAPWQVWQMYGDRSLLERHYGVMRRYVDYLAGKSHRHVVAHGLGDWYDIGPRGPGASQLTSPGLTATATYYADLVILAETARHLGKAEDARRYGGLAAEVRAAFQDKFFHAPSNLYDRGSQAAQAMPLVLGLVEADRREAVAENLVRAIRGGGNRVTAGDVGFMYVVRALSDADRGDVLCDMVRQPEGPGYADQLRKGATTLTEAWDADRRSSQNHCMLGHAEEWFYRGLAGIAPDPAGPGFKRFVLRPQPVGGLTWVRAHYDSVHGRIASHWRIEGGRFLWEITVPPNTTATVHLPAKDPAGVLVGGRPAAAAEGVRLLERGRERTVYEVPSGSYEFSAGIGR